MNWRPKIENIRIARTSFVHPLLSSSFACFLRGLFGTSFLVFLNGLFRVVRVPSLFTRPHGANCIPSRLQNNILVMTNSISSEEAHRSITEGEVNGGQQQVDTQSGPSVFTGELAQFMRKGFRVLAG